MVTTLWEEKLNTKLRRSNHMQENLETGDTTSETKNDSIPTQCENTGNGWIRNCPKCNKELFYSSLKSFRICEKKSSICCSCGCIEREKRRDKTIYKTPEYRKKMSDALKIARKNSGSYGDSFKEKCKVNAIKQWSDSKIRKLHEDVMSSDAYREKHRINSLNMWKTSEHISKMQSIHSSDKYRLKRRLITRQILKQKISNGRLSSYSKKACVFADKVGGDLGYNFQHGENGGEYEIVGYSLDGYDKSKNVVFEYDEPYHYDFNGNLKPKDIRRQNDVIRALNPTAFLRYNEKKKILYNSLDGKVLWQ